MLWCIFICVKYYYFCKSFKFLCFIHEVFQLVNCYSMYKLMEFTAHVDFRAPATAWVLSYKEGQRNRYHYFGRCGAFIHCCTVSVTQWYASNTLHNDNSKFCGYGTRYFSAILCMHSICKCDIDHCIIRVYKLMSGYIRSHQTIPIYHTYIHSPWKMAILTKPHIIKFCKPSLWHQTSVEAVSDSSDNSTRIKWSQKWLH